MQEEVTRKTIALAIKTAKLDGKVLQAALRKLLQLYRSYFAAVQFLDDMEQRGIAICSITDGDLPLCRELYHGIVNAYRSSSEKGGECR